MKSLINNEKVNASEPPVFWHMPCYRAVKAVMERKRTEHAGAFVNATATSVENKSNVQRRKL
jgi:hypothetical protein